METGAAGLLGVGCMGEVDDRPGPVSEALSIRWNVTDLFTSTLTSSKPARRQALVLGRSPCHHRGQWSTAEWGRPPTIWFSSAHSSVTIGSVREVSMAVRRL
jgi:hypothetical protein